MPHSPRFLLQGEDRATPTSVELHCAEQGAQGGGRMGWEEAGPLLGSDATLLPTLDNPSRPGPPVRSFVVCRL